MLNQSIPVENVIFKVSAFIAERKLQNDKNSQHDLGVVFDLLKMLGLPDNALFMLYQDRADELDLTDRRSLIKCQVCQDMATGLIRTKGGRYMTVCPRCSRDLQRCGAILLLGDEIVDEDPDLIQSLRAEMIAAEA